MSARRKKPTNVISLAEFRQPTAASVAPSYSGPDALDNARIVAEFARRLGVDLRLVAAIQRGDLPDVTPGTG
jgi:hypothetical protein